MLLPPSTAPPPHARTQRFGPGCARARPAPCPRTSPQTRRALAPGRRTGSAARRPRPRPPGTLRGGGTGQTKDLREWLVWHDAMWWPTAHGDLLHRRKKHELLLALPLREAAAASPLPGHSLKPFCTRKLNVCLSQTIVNLFSGLLSFWRHSIAIVLKFPARGGRRAEGAHPFTAAALHSPRARDAGEGNWASQGALRRTRHRGHGAAAPRQPQAPPGDRSAETPHRCRACTRRAPRCLSPRSCR